MMNNDLQRFYLLHSRPFKETSLLLDCLSERDGRVSLIAKGAKRPKSPWRGILQVFMPLLGQWVGKSELKTLCKAEMYSGLNVLIGKKMFVGMYVNEVLTRVLHQGESLPKIFQLYDDLLQTDLDEKALRGFELQLLTALGYGLNLKTDAETGQLIQSDLDYVFTHHAGFKWIDGLYLNEQTLSIKGASLLAMGEGDFSRPDTLRDAKRIMRLAFQPLLGDKPLKSRELYRSIVSGSTQSDKATP